ncbi:hypothetical protein ACFWA5_29625 [Streptomyces mirabilis]|uniref:hypothetical protein n=1 Tax=Streptomyces mirabilis TaxID=68239 RepID=UPI003649984D
MATNHLCRVLLADFDAMPYREPTSPAGSSSPLRHASCMWTGRRSRRRRSRPAPGRRLYPPASDQTSQEAWRLTRRTALKNRFLPET